MRTIALDRSVAMIPDGASLMIGGFMGVGTSERVVDEIVRQNKRDLTVIANDTAVPGKGVGKLVGAKLLRRAIVSHIGLNPETQRQMMAGELDVELVPQGTLIERIRADGPGILLVEQNVIQSLAIASRAYMLENGSVVLEGPAATMSDDPQLKKAYLGL